jgi:hypothetical protein
LSIKRMVGVIAPVALLAALLIPVGPARAATTYEIGVGQDFFEDGVPGFSARFYPGSIRVHDGDTIHFDFPPGLGPEGAYPQEHIGENDTHIGDPGSFFEFDPDEGNRALKFNLAAFFDPGADCGSQDNPCVWGPNSDVIFPAFPEEGPPDIYVLIDADPGTTLWAASAGASDVNVNFKVEVVANNEAASTQQELDARGDSLRRKDREDAHALHERMSAKKTWHRNAAGRKVFDVFVGASGGPIEMFASYPERIAIPKGARVQFHFMSQVEPHTATFGGPNAREVFNNFLMPACDPDGDDGTAPDVEASFDPETGQPLCPDGTTLEGDVHPRLPWNVGDGRVRSNNDYENSGLIFPRFPDGGSFDVNPSPWTVSFPNTSDRKGFKYICLIHGGFMGGRVRVRN